MNFLGYLYFWVAFSDMTHGKAWFDISHVQVVLFKRKPPKFETNKLIYTNHSKQV